MKVFVSHSYFTDDTVANSLYKTFTENGIHSYNHQELSNRLKPRYTGGSDLDDLIRAYRRGGRPAPTQEQSDSNLHEFIVEDIAKQNVVVILWSEQYAQKFWTQREMRTALSRGIQLIVIIMETYALDEDIERGVQCGLIPLFRFNADFNPLDICKAIFNLSIPTSLPSPVMVYDKGLMQNFVRIDHPSLGTYEILQSYFNWGDMKQFSVKEPPSEFKTKDLGDHISHEYIAEFCHFISQQSPYFKYRLPSESEWEFAARAGSTAIHDWVMDSKIDLDGVPTVCNLWGIFFAPNAFEWTSTRDEWQEYLGWVQPIEISDNHFGSDRAYVVKRINDGPGKGGYYPRIVQKNKEEGRLGFRLVREYRNDINIDHVIPTRHLNVARELLSEVDPLEFQTLVGRMTELGYISRYFRAYLERCIQEGSWDMAEPLLNQILMTNTIRPVSLPPYLFKFFHQSLTEVFDNTRPADSFTCLLDKLKEIKLLGREFAEVLLYDFIRNPNLTSMFLTFDSCWQECLERIDEKEKELLFRFNGL
jgi:hypothetical protein